MGLGIWAQSGERRHGARLVAQALVAVTAGADLAQLGDAVAVVVNSDVILDVENLLHGGVLPLIHFVRQRLVARVALDVGVHVVIGRAEVCDLIVLVAHSYKI